MIHWTIEALRPCLLVLVQFFWGESAWGLTEGLRRLRAIRFVILILSLLSISLIVWAVVERTVVEAARSEKFNDSYSYYEGKLLEERLAQAQKKIEIQNGEIAKLLEEGNARTLLLVKMQSQLDKQQEIIDAGIKILGAVIATPILAILWGIFRTGLRRERPNLANIPGIKKDKDVGRRIEIEGE